MGKFFRRGSCGNVYLQLKEIKIILVMGTAKQIGLIIKVNYEYNKTSPRIL